jgi:hypothetical protein
MNFYPRVVNKTIFDNDEVTLLNKDLIYNLNHKHKSWLNTLDLKAKTAIKLLPTVEQHYIRYQVAHDIKCLYEKQATLICLLKCPHFR